MNPSEALSLDKQRSLHVEVGMAALSVAPEDWSEIHYEIAALARFSRSSLVALLESGDRVRLPPPMLTGGKMLKLRAGMYRPGQGTWFTAKYTIARPAKFSVDFDYENEPDFSPSAFDFEPVLETFAEELELFPRDAEYLPDWLRQKADEAQAGGWRIEEGSG